MKKVILLTILMVCLFCSNAFAAWTLTVTAEERTQHYIKWKVTCVSDGNALTATDLVALMPAAVSRVEQSLMKMKVVPGTGGAKPTTTIDVTLTDDEDDTLYSTTGVTNVGTTWKTLSDSISVYPPVFTTLKLTLNDIGDAADSVTLYFISWVEDK